MRVTRPPSRSARWFGNVTPVRAQRRCRHPPASRPRINLAPPTMARHPSEQVRTDSERREKGSGRVGRRPALPLTGIRHETSHGPPDESGPASSGSRSISPRSSGKRTARGSVRRCCFPARVHAAGCFSITLAPRAHPLAPKAHPMGWSPCSRRGPRLPRTHEGPLSTLRVLQLPLLAAVRVLDLHGTLLRLRPAVHADAVTPTDTPRVGESERRAARGLPSRPAAV